MEKLTQAAAWTLVGSGSRCVSVPRTAHQPQRQELVRDADSQACSVPAWAESELLTLGNSLTWNVPGAACLLAFPLLQMTHSLSASLSCSALDSSLSGMFSALLSTHTIPHPQGLAQKPPPSGAFSDHPDENISCPHPAAL